MLLRFISHNCLILNPPFSGSFRTPRFQVSHLTMGSSTVNGDASLGPIYFWREFEEPYGFLSQWYEDPFEVEGVTYQSAEMWMMVQKALLFGDEVGKQSLFVN